MCTELTMYELITAWQTLLFLVEANEDSKEAITLLDQWEI